MRLTFWNERKAHYDWHCENNEIADKLAAYEDTELSPEEFKKKSESVLELYGKLKPYADAEEQGRLVILPCKVGETVWRVNFDKRRKSIEEIRFDVNVYTAFGKTVFLTREEAEAALNGGQNDG